MKVDRYEPGRFCWAELETTNQEDAVRFYGGLFGWDAEERAIDQERTYSTFKLNGDNSAAAFPFNREQMARGHQPMWRTYVSVNDAFETTQKAAQLGGRVITEPTDIFDNGRMAVIQDPTGAFIELWEAGTRQGAERQSEPGSITWNELMTDDTRTAQEFYCALFGWTASRQDTPTGEYITFMDGDEQIAGMMAKPENMADAPSSWMVYFAVSDCADSANRSLSLGAHVAVEPTDIPGVGQFAVIQDPEGAVFSILEPAKSIAP